MAKGLKKDRNAKKRAAQSKGVKKRTAQKRAADSKKKAGKRAVQGCPLAGKGLDNLAKKYAAQVEASKPWQWDDIEPGLTKGQREKIREKARADGLLPSVPLDKKQDYVNPKPDAPFVKFPKKFIAAEDKLPQSKWLNSDRSQFKWLDERVKANNPDYDPKTRSFKGSEKRYTWHHAQDPPGTMQLVEFGAHNSTNHSGGRNVWGGGTDYR